MKIRALRRNIIAESFSMKLTTCTFIIALRRILSTELINLIII